MDDGSDQAATARAALRHRADIARDRATASELPALSPRGFPSAFIARELFERLFFPAEANEITWGKTIKLFQRQTHD